MSERFVRSQFRASSACEQGAGWKKGRRRRKSGKRKKNDTKKLRSVYEKGNAKRKSVRKE